jgi:hypothetical protein
MNEKIEYKDGWSYQIFDDGYEIWGPLGIYITQRGRYSKIYKPDGTFEENALIQLEILTTPPAAPDLD